MKNGNTISNNELLETMNYWRAKMGKELLTELPNTKEVIKNKFQKNGIKW